MLEASLDDEGWCEDCVKMDEYAAKAIVDAKVELIAIILQSEEA